MEVPAYQQNLSSINPNYEHNMDRMPTFQHKTTSNTNRILFSEEKTANLQKSDDRVSIAKNNVKLNTLGATSGLKVQTKQKHENIRGKTTDIVKNAVDHKSVLFNKHQKLIQKKMDKLEKEIEKQKKKKDNSQNMKIALCILFPIPLIGIILSLGRFNMISSCNYQRKKAKNKILNYEEKLLNMTNVVDVNVVANVGTNIYTGGDDYDD